MACLPGIKPHCHYSVILFCRHRCAAGSSSYNSLPKYATTVIRRPSRPPHRVWQADNAVQQHCTHSVHTACMAKRAREHFARPPVHVNQSTSCTFQSNQTACRERMHSTLVHHSDIHTYTFGAEQHRLRKSTASQLVSQPFWVGQLPRGK